ncbi:unnamed protein product [Nyctereutes procyonoides]|uniref:(raccoon dog) hypothetical protein n=1 Tax=Nyctereutes procyonoides TaxID=34880 RepID=A0A811Z2I8_NYCPR|nr:unnamed protein product [Nyctereutes procyonoides]
MGHQWKTNRLWSCPSLGSMVLVFGFWVLFVLFVLFCFVFSELEFAIFS